MTPDRPQTPKLVLEMQHIIMAARLAMTPGMRGMPADDPRMLQFAMAALRTPRDAFERDAGRESLNAAWSCYRRVKALGWAEPEELRKAKSKTTGLAIAARKAKRVKA